MNQSAGWHEQLIGVPANVRRWLSDQGSLTRRISRRCADFNVCNVRQRRCHVLLDEAAIVGLALKQQALLREVYLCCGAHPVIFAHSVLPRVSLVGQWAKLGNLGNRSLGATLFADPQVYRSPLQYRRLDARHFLYRQAIVGVEQAPSSLWARRSLLMLAERRILVTEVFLPGVFEL
ncbi:MAG: chorismate--pyruvate lyase family protein [Sulfuriferula sp.]